MNNIKYENEDGDLLYRGGSILLPSIGDTVRLPTESKVHVSDEFEVVNRIFDIDCNRHPMSGIYSDYTVILRKKES